MKRAVLFAGVAITVAVFGTIATARQPAEPVALPALTSSPPRYPDVQPIFAKHCSECHDKARSKNAAAMAVFEMSSYPFSTERPGTLLEDLRGMFENRGSLSAEEKRRGLAWLAGGALDADGKPPRWR